MPHRDTKAHATPAPSAISARARRSARQQAAQTPAFTFARKTNAHEEHPERNEDYIIADAAYGLVGVFDGVGGVIGGEIASRIAAQHIAQQWKRLVQQQLPQQHKRTANLLLLNEAFASDLEEQLRQLVIEAHTQVRSEGLKRAKTQYGEMAEAATPKTTIALAICFRTQRAQGKNVKRYRLIYAWVGDSRIYHLRPEKPLLRLTSDDGLLTELVNSQLLTEDEALHIDQTTHSWELNRIQRIYFERRNGITQALGDREPPNVHIAETTIAPGDRVLFSTDGIHDNLTDKELEALMKSGARTTVAEHIVHAAVERSRQSIEEVVRSKPDDMSAVVVTCHH